MSDQVVTTALAPRPAPAQDQQFSLIPSTFEQAMQFAKVMADSDLVPKDFRGKPANCFIAVQMGLEVGLSPMAAIQNIAVINGRPAIWGDSVLAIVRGSGQLAAILEEVVGVDDMLTAVCTVTRRGEQSASRTFSMADAKRAGLAGKDGPWKQYPKRMLQMRARAFALRDVFPDVLKGIAIREEAEDIIEVTATPVSEPQRLTLASSTPTDTPTPATSSAPAVSSSAPTTPVLHGAFIHETEAIEPGVWEVRAVVEATGEHVTFATKDEAIYKQAASAEGTEAKLAIAWRQAKKADGSAVKALVGLAADDGGAS